MEAKQNRINKKENFLKLIPMKGMLLFLLLLLMVMLVMSDEDDGDSDGGDL